MRKLLFFSTFMLLLASACNNAESDKSGHIYIISTNDMHANIDAMPRLATLVKEYEAKGEVLLVDSGDRVTGNAYVDDDNRPGVPMIELMNEIGFDVVTLGNHEFDKGRDALYAMVDASEFEWVCANMSDLQGDRRIVPYTTCSVEGVEICFVGVVATDFGGRPMGGDASYVDFSFTEDYTTAYERCHTVAPEQDFVIVLSHMGYDMDLRLAEMLPSCDWIAGGHSHDTVNEDVSGVHISQNRKDIRYVTVADIEFLNGEVTKVTYTQLATEDFAEDSHIRTMVDNLKATDPDLNNVIAHANARATKDGIANFTCEALKGYPYAEGFTPEVVFYHYGGVRLSSIEEGDVKCVDILNNDPFVSTIYIGELTVEQMRNFILEKYNNGTAEKPDKESHYAYFRSNIPYDILLGTTPAEQPDALDIRFDLEEGTYRVAMCNYIAENYIHDKEARAQLRPITTTVRDAMLHLMCSYGEAGYTPDNEVYQREVTK